MKVSRKTFAIAFVLFFLVFNPPLVKGLSFAIIAVVCSFLYCYKNRTALARLVNNKLVRGIIGAFLIFILYDIVQAVIHGFSGNPLIYSNLGADLLSDFSIFSVGFAFALYAIKHRWDIVYFFKVYAIVGVYQACIGLLCLVSPAVKTTLNNIVMANSHSEKIRDSVEKVSEYRNFGFASSTYDNFGFALTVLALIAATLGLNGEKKYFVVSFLIAAVAVMNGRSSFVFYMAGLTVLLLSSQGKITANWIAKRVAFFAVAIVAIGVLFSWIIQNESSEQMMWIAAAITATQSLSEGEHVGFFDAFMNEFLIFPPDVVSNLFGVGMNPADAIDHNSDTGYIQYLWKYGILGSILLYRKFYILIRNAKRSLDWPFSIYAKTLIIILSLYLIKLACLGYGMSASVYAPLCFFAIFSSTLRAENLKINNQFV